MQEARYTAVRSVKDTQCHVLYHSDMFESLPHALRSRGPWHVLHRGPLTELLAPYRLALRRGVYCVIEARLPQYRALSPEQAAAWAMWHDAD